MASRYIPPHLRATSSQQSFPGASTAPGQQGGDDSPRGPLHYSLEDLAAHYRVSEKQGTLNHADSDEGSISHILVYHDQHPDWPGKIFCKTNLNLLASYEQSLNQNISEPAPTANASQEQEDVSEDPSETEPAHPPTAPTAPSSIPVYTSSPRPHDANNVAFSFNGYHHIRSITYLAPHSPELISMLERKFTGTEPGRHRVRSRASWAASLATPWAVVELALDEAKRDEGCGVVKVREKSVAERLEELRRRDRESEREQ